MSYKTICPVCNHNSFYVTPGKALKGYCFNNICNYAQWDSEVKYEAPKPSKNLKEIREYYKYAAEYFHSNIDERARKLLHSRGYTDESIKRFKIGYSPPGYSLIYKDTIAKEAGIAVPGEHTAFFADAITFPYLHKNGQVWDIRARMFEAIDGKRYISPYNSVIFRGATIPYNYAASTADVVLITEGEIKSGIPSQYGYETMGLPGMGLWRKSYVPKEKKHIIIFDNQLHNWKNVVAAIDKTATHTPEGNTYVATLPLLGQDKMDNDTFINLRGPEEFGLVLKAALPYNKWRPMQRV